ALIERLHSNKSSRHSSFNPLSLEGKCLPFNNYLHQYPYILTANGQFLTAMEIYKFAIQEVYEFCKKNLLVAFWYYFWSKWYNNKRWSLWAQSACTNKIPILKMIMFVKVKLEKTIKVSLEEFPICKHLILQKGVVLPDFFGKVQRNHQLPFLYKNGQDLIQNDSSNLNIYSNDLTNANQPDFELEHDCNTIYNQLIISTKKAFKLLEQQKIGGNFRWEQSVAKNFNPLIKMVNDIESYKKRRVMPLMQKDHNHNTLFFLL
ncbi:27503_t:CDS:2, partial [Gigaspora margarita]